MKNPTNILEVEDLHTQFFTESALINAVAGISFEVPKGKTLAIVGESGCGKSATSLSILRLIKPPQGRVTAKSMLFNTDTEVLDLSQISEQMMQKIRGNKISIIFQEPMTSLNPIFTIGFQLDEVINTHTSMSKADIKNHSLAMLRQVGIPRETAIYSAYPHELSGGMCQRVCIAMALMCNPSLIIADEPTTALDVTIQAQILDLLLSIKEQSQTALILITHDLGVVAEVADDVIVMYAGKIIEKGSVQEIFQNPLHPYTQGLLRSKPVLHQNQTRLYSIQGQVPNPADLMQDSCYFHDRCTACFAACKRAYPPCTIFNNHEVVCYLYQKGNCS